jgi:sugar lactone lactonase YvrE
VARRLLLALCGAFALGGLGCAGPAELACGRGRDGCGLALSLPSNGRPAHLRDDLDELAFAVVPGRLDDVRSELRQLPFALVLDTVDGTVVATRRDEVLVGLPSGELASYAPHRERVVWAEGERAWGLALDDSGAYWTASGTPGTGEVRACAAPGAPVRVLARGPDGLEGIAVDALYVYWIEFSTRRVMRATKAGRDVVMLAESPPFPSALAVDAKRVYWIARTGEHIHVMSVDKHGGALQRLTTAGAPSGERSNKRRIAIDDRYVYWNGQSRVLRAPKEGGMPETVATLRGNGDVVSFWLGPQGFHATARVYPRPQPYRPGPL